MNGQLLLQIAASIVPQQAALIDDTKTWTYEQLLVEGQRMAYMLHTHVKEGDTVAILLTNRAEYIATLLACWQLGAVAMPLNTRLKEAEINDYVVHAACVVTEERYRTYAFKRPKLLIEQVSTMYEDLTEHAQALTLLTSGSSAAPKKVEIFHEQFAGYIFSHHEAPDGTDKGRYLNAVPLFHITGLTAVFNALYSGRTVVLQEGFRAEAWLANVEQHRITHSFVVPTMLYDVLQVERATEQLQTLQHITYGGAPMPRAIIEQAITTLPHVAFSNAYGLTETTATITALTADDHQLTDDKKRARLASVGKPLADVELRIRNGQTLCAPYEVGVVEVKTARLNGYLGEAVPSWFVTHDTGYVDEDGYLFLQGRSSDVIVRGGENISAHEVEAALRQLPSIIDAAVVGIPHARWGEAVAAMIVATEPLQPNELTLQLKEKLASFKVPRVFTFVQKLPLHATGKVDKRQIVRIFYEEKGDIGKYGE